MVRISPRLIDLTVYGIVPFFSVSRFEIALQRVTAALAGRARYALQAERKREPSDFVGGEAGEVGDVRYGKALVFHFAGGVV